MAKATYAPNNQNRSAKIDMTVVGFTGMNMDSPDTIQDSDFANAYDVVYDSVNAVETRPGSAKLLTASLDSPILGMGAFVNSGLSMNQLVYVAGQTASRYDNAGSSIAFANTFSVATRWEFVMFNGVLLACNGKDGILQYTGFGNFTVINSTYKPIAMTAHRNRLYFFEANAQAIRYSDPFVPSSVPAGNVMQVLEGEEYITALNSNGETLFVGRARSCLQITGDPVGSGDTTNANTLQVKKASAEVGPTNQRAVVTISQGVKLFVSYDGIYVFQGNTATLISKELNPIFKSGVNPQFMHLAYCNYNRNQKKFIVGVPSAESNTCDTIIMLDLQDPKAAKFAVWTGLPGAQAVNFRFAAGQDTTLIAHPTKGFIYQLYTGYADIYGDWGTATSGGASTLTDTSKSWTTNALADAPVRIIAGTGRGQRRFVASNTDTQITLDSAWSTQPDSTSVYTVGGYNSFCDTKIFNQSRPALDKKYKFWDVFTDSEANHSLKVNVAYDYLPLSAYTDLLSLDNGGMKWGMTDPDTGVRMKWGKAGKKWGGKKKLHKRLELGGEQAKQVQYRFGNDLPNQPWRVTMHVTTYKERKNRPDW